MAGLLEEINNRQIKLFSRIVATILFALIIYGLINSDPPKFLSNLNFKDFAVEAEVTRKIELKPEVVKALAKIQSKNQEVQKQIPPPIIANKNNTQIVTTKKGTGEPSSLVGTNLPEATNSGVSTSSGINTNSGEKVQNSLPGFSAAVEKTVYAIDCRKIDKEDRPKDCPPTDDAKQMVKAVQAPKYNPQKVTGFSNAEMNSKKVAGWREPCENESGGKYQVCIPFGKKPPRVKTPIELCKEKGLENCKYPNRPDGTSADPILTKE